MGVQRIPTSEVRPNDALARWTTYYPRRVGEALIGAATVILMALALAITGIVLTILAILWTVGLAILTVPTLALVLLGVFAWLPVFVGYVIGVSISPRYTTEEVMEVEGWKTSNVIGGGE